MRWTNLRLLAYGGGLFMAALLLYAALAVYENRGWAGNPFRQRVEQTAQSRLTLAQIPFNGQRAYENLLAICKLGPRPSGSAAMLSQQEMLSEYFQKLGGKVNLQRFRIRHPRDGSEVRMANLLVSWHPDRKQRILICAHYDTRPYPDRDPENPRGVFLGANDGASGPALLMELALHVRELPGELGVDFALFDGEEFVFNDATDIYFFGSEYFARQYAAKQIDANYRWAVLIDMTADADLQIYEERGSIARNTRPLVNEIWHTAARLGVQEFIARPKHELRDDHLPLRQTGKIAAIDIIDFDYPYWHTTQDTPDHCSALSLAKVGWVLSEWLREAVKK